MSHRLFRFGSAVVCTALLASVAFPAMSHAQRRGRKYKAPPPTSHIAVEVVRNDNGKPISNAAVVFHPTRDGHDEGNLEVKTNENGVADIDVIPTGSKVEVQVIAPGFSTFASDYMVEEASRSIQIKMLRPRAQVSAYEDNSGKAAERAPGVQEPAYLTKAPAAQAAAPAAPSQPDAPK